MSAFDEWFDRLAVGDVVVVSRHLAADELGAVESRTKRYVTVRGLRFNHHGHVVGGGYSVTKIEQPRPGQVERIRAEAALHHALRKVPSLSSWGRPRELAGVSTEAIAEAAALIRRATALLLPVPDTGG